MNYILSIIIPVYKAEEYIEECLDSVFSQITDAIEIIIVNDGTPDRSIDIIRSKYASWLARDQVVLLEQKNAGPGAARNAGLDVARGQYIGFLDSDDVLLENYFITLLDILATYKTDIVEFGFQRFHEISDIKNEEYKSPYTLTGLHEIEKVRNEIFSKGVWFPWIRVYKREIFEEFRFPVGVFYEDLMVIPYIYLKDLKAYFVDKPLIGYRFNPNSTTALHIEAHLNDMYRFYISLLEIEDTIPINILKIRTARSIAYFYNELNVLDFPINEILKDIKIIKRQSILLKNLKLPDLLFFILPKVYMLVDKIRLKNNKGKN